MNPGEGQALNLRTGSPGQRSTATMALPFEGAGRITSIAFSYRFVIGYGVKAGSKGTQLSLGFVSNLDCPSAGNTTVLYTSPRFTSPSWGKCHECYSAPVNVSLSNLDLRTANGGALSLEFDNGDHNMQVLLPLTIRVGWA